jgi:hypothetical protein
MNFPILQDNELYAISYDQSYNLYTSSIYNQIDWFWMSIKKLKKGDLFMLGGNFILPDWLQGNKLIAEIEAALSRGANIILIITRFYVGGYNQNGQCFQNGCSPNPDDSLKWKCPDTKGNDPSLQDVLYTWGCFSSNYIGKLKGVTVVDLPDKHNNNPYSHCKLISFFYKSDNTMSVFHGSANLDTNKGGHSQNEVGWGYMCKLSEPFAQYLVFREIDILLLYQRYYLDSNGKTQAIGIDEAVNIIQPFKTGTEPPTLPMKIKTFRFCGPKMCFAKDEENTYKCGTTDQQRPFYCKSNNEKWVYGIDYDVEIMVGLTPGKITNLPNWDTKGFPSYYPDHVDLLAQMIDEGTYFKSTILSQGIDQSPYSIPQRYRDSLQKFLSAGKKWFQIQASPTVNQLNTSFGSFVSTLKNSNNLYFRNFCVNKGWGNDISERTHEKFYMNDKSVMYSSGHPENTHLEGPIINECIIINNAPNFHNYAETFFNYEWIFGTCPYTIQYSSPPYAAPTDPTTDFIYCSNSKNQIPGTICCMGDMSRVIDNYNVASLEKLDLCKNTCSTAQLCDPTTGICSDKPVAPDSKYSCIKNTCVKDDNGTMSFDDCKAQCNTNYGKSCKNSFDCSDNLYCINNSCQKYQIPNNNNKNNSNTSLIISLIILLSIISFIYFYKKNQTINKFRMQILISLSLLFTILIVFLLKEYIHTEDSTKYSCINNKCIIDTNGILSKEDCEKKCIKPPPPKFSQLKGLSGDGLCYGPQNSYPYSKKINSISSLDACQNLCETESNCVGLNYSLDGQVCTLYSKNKLDGYDPTSPNWKDTYSFPTYSSPYICPYPIQIVANCRNDFPDSCTKITDNSVCFVKNDNTKENYIDYTIKVGKEDGLKAQVVVSNPYIPSYSLSKIKNSFYYWFIDLINAADKFLIICNVYNTLGKYQSDDPEDYQSLIHICIINALKRGINIKIIVTAGDQQECVESVFNQILYKPYIQNKQLTVTSLGFFHDKIYVSDKKAYIGGQNMSGSSSVDFGISFSVDSPLYNDVLMRANNIASYFYKSPLNFEYTATSPFIDSNGTQYFIAVSPTWPICSQQPYRFPQGPCTTIPKNPTGTYQELTYNNMKKNWETVTGTGNVSYERNQVLNLVNNSQKFIILTNYEWSFFGDVASVTGYDLELRDSILNAAERNIDINIWMNNSVISESKNAGNTVCNMLRCPEGIEFINKLTSYNNVKIHWWYNGDKNDNSTICHTLHSKIYYSDWGLLVSSSNYTPSYFQATSDTGLCAIFNIAPPEWISVGVQNVIDILKTYPKCDNKTGNFDGVGACIKCPDSYSCVNNCMS